MPYNHLVYGVGIGLLFCMVCFLLMLIGATLIYTIAPQSMEVAIKWRRRQKLLAGITCILLLVNTLVLCLSVYLG